MSSFIEKDSTASQNSEEQTPDEEEETQEPEEESEGEEPEKEAKETEPGNRWPRHPLSPGAKPVHLIHSWDSYATIESKQTQTQSKKSWDFMQQKAPQIKQAIQQRGGEVIRGADGVEY